MKSIYTILMPRFSRFVSYLLPVILFVTSLSYYLFQIRSTSCANIINSPLNNQRLISKLGPSLKSNVSSLPVLRGMEFNPSQPLNFKVYVDTMDKSSVSSQDLHRIVKYFLACMTIPEEKLWVNLSPYEKDRISPEELAQVDIGKDMLLQDYLLKKLSSAVTNPKTDYGKCFWQKVYRAAQQIAGTTNVPINTCYKVWIVPDIAEVYESCLSGTGKIVAFVKNARLKVMMEEDYHNNVKQQGKGLNSHVPKRYNLRVQDTTSVKIQQINNQAKEIFKRDLLPFIQEQVNNSLQFAPIRQIYSSLILAVYFKQKLSKHPCYSNYINKEKISYIKVSQKNVKQIIYNSYLETFQKGMYQYQQREYDFFSREKVTRNYFSGGLGLDKISQQFRCFSLSFDRQWPFVGRKLPYQLNLIPQRFASFSLPGIASKDNLEKPKVRLKNCRELLKEELTYTNLEVIKDNLVKAIAYYPFDFSTFNQNKDELIDIAFRVSNLALQTVKQYLRYTQSLAKEKKNRLLSENYHLLEYLSKLNMYSLEYIDFINYLVDARFPNDYSFSKGNPLEWFIFPIVRFFRGISIVGWLARERLPAKIAPISDLIIQLNLDKYFSFTPEVFNSQFQEYFKGLKEREKVPHFGVTWWWRVRTMGSWALSGIRVMILPIFGMAFFGPLLGLSVSMGFSFWFIHKGMTNHLEVRMRKKTANKLIVQLQQTKSQLESKNIFPLELTQPSPTGMELNNAANRTQSLLTSIIALLSAGNSDQISFYDLECLRQGIDHLDKKFFTLSREDDQKSLEIVNNLRIAREVYSFLRHANIVMVNIYLTKTMHKDAYGKDLERLKVMGRRVLKYFDSNNRAQQMIIEKLNLWFKDFQHKTNLCKYPRDKSEQLNVVLQKYSLTIELVSSYLTNNRLAELAKVYKHIYQQVERIIEIHLKNHQFKQIPEETFKMINQLYKAALKALSCYCVVESVNNHHMSLRYLLPDDHYLERSKIYSLIRILWGINYLRLNSISTIRIHASALGCNIEGFLSFLKEQEKLAKNDNKGVGLAWRERKFYTRANDFFRWAIEVSYTLFMKGFYPLGLVGVPVSCAFSWLAIYLSKRFGFYYRAKTGLVSMQKKFKLLPQRVRKEVVKYTDRQGVQFIIEDVLPQIPNPKKSREFYSFCPVLSLLSFKNKNLGGISLKETSTLLGIKSQLTNDSSDPYFLGFDYSLKPE